MSTSNSKISRRALVAAGLGGAAVAVAAVREKGIVRLEGAGFNNFKSEHFALDRSNHAGWEAMVGQLVQVVGGPVMRIASVERFAPFKNRARGTSRDRAFMVTFQVNGGAVASDTIHSITSARTGRFDIYLTTSPTKPGHAQAVFN